MNYVFSSIVGAGLVPALSTTGNHENQGNHKGLPLQTDKQSKYPTTTQGYPYRDNINI